MKEGYLERQSKDDLAESIRKILAAYLIYITISDLKSAAIRSLWRFADTQYNGWVKSFGFDPSPLKAATLGKPETVGTQAAGVANQEYHKEYMRRAKTVVERLAQENALDPDDVSGRNSLRNRAEMEVRYHGHLDRIEALRAQGVRLVVCSVHADCSDRCYPWQGRIYSLDGSFGVTKDGRRYVPLEQATDVYYATKSGRVYKNGLLGFNCRHTITPYVDGMVIPIVSERQRRYQYRVNTTQRRMEREIRTLRAEAEMLKGIDERASKGKLAKARGLYQSYQKFSREHDRAFYPDRVAL